MLIVQTEYIIVSKTELDYECVDIVYDMVILNSFLEFVNPFMDQRCNTGVWSQITRDKYSLVMDVFDSQENYTRSRILYPKQIDYTEWIQWRIKWATASIPVKSTKNK